MPFQIPMKVLCNKSPILMCTTKLDLPRGMLWWCPLQNMINYKSPVDPALLAVCWLIQW